MREKREKIITSVKDDDDDDDDDVRNKPYSFYIQISKLQDNENYPI